MRTPRSPAYIMKQLDGLLAGTAMMPPTDVLMVDGKPTTVADLRAQLTADRAVYQKVPDTAAAHSTAVQERDTAAPQIESRCTKTRAVVKAMLGKQNPGLKAFGIEPDKTPRALTAPEKVAQQAKSKATRVARHTMSKKQKEEIHGDPAAPKAP